VPETQSLAYHETRKKIREDYGHEQGVDFRLHIPMMLVGLVVAVVPFATGLKASNLLAGKSSSALDTYSVDQVKQMDQPRSGAPLTPTGSGFTYQGSLKSDGVPASGNHDFQFSLYDALEGAKEEGVQEQRRSRK
jgi:hypothetical protein